MMAPIVMLARRTCVGAKDEQRLNWQMDTRMGHDLAMDGVEAFLDSYGLLAVFGVMLLKEFGLPIPIPADLIMIGVAARAAQGRLSPVEAFLAILVPMLIGGVVQYSLARGPGRRLIYRLGRYIGLTQVRLDRMMERIRSGGTAAVAAGLTTPGLRIATTPASGLANLAPRSFVTGLALGSTFFLGWHFAIGYAGGVALNALHLPAPAVAGVLALVIVFGVAVIALARRRQVRREPGSGAVGFADWADASCPVCAAITLAGSPSGKSPTTEAIG
jgi:membrane protein DedA with SNARE-associated domain